MDRVHSTLEMTNICLVAVMSGLIWVKVTWTAVTLPVVARLSTSSQSVCMHIAVKGSLVIQGGWLCEVSCLTLPSVGTVKAISGKTSYTALNVESDFGKIPSYPYPISHSQ